MELKRYNVMNSSENVNDCYEGDYIEWTLELQEAWDKQQEVEIIDQYITEPFDNIKVQELRGNCPRCHMFIFEQEIKYCDNCGQKIKW